MKIIHTLNTETILAVLCTEEYNALIRVAQGVLNNPPKGDLSPIATLETTEPSPSPVPRQPRKYTRRVAQRSKREPSSTAAAKLCIICGAPTKRARYCAKIACKKAVKHLDNVAYREKSKAVRVPSRGRKGHPVNPGHPWRATGRRVAASPARPLAVSPNPADPFLSAPEKAAAIDRIRQANERVKAREA